ncbi:hypothetical protein TNCV_2038441 [Trichonephila clavipes]|nr:hypothetical protein TNCV_2038441 [Trichonephila clavipes]
MAAVAKRPCLRTSGRCCRVTVSKPSVTEDQCGNLEGVLTQLSFRSSDHVLKLRVSLPIALVLLQSVM